MYSHAGSAPGIGARLVVGVLSWGKCIFWATKTARRGVPHRCMASYTAAYQFGGQPRTNWRTRPRVGVARRSGLMFLHRAGRAGGSGDSGGKEVGQRIHPSYKTVGHKQTNRSLSCCFLLHLRSSPSLLHRQADRPHVTAGRGVIEE